MEPEPTDNGHLKWVKIEQELEYACADLTDFEFGVICRAVSTEKLKKLEEAGEVSYPKQYR